MATFWTTFKKGLSKTSENFMGHLQKLFRGKEDSKELFQALEEFLIESDFGVPLTEKVLSFLHQQKRSSTTEMEEILQHLYSFLYPSLVAKEKKLLPGDTLSVFLMVGANGSGKTTLIGKLAALWKPQGKRIRVVAGDTFRAAATEQLACWAEKSGTALTVGQEGQDPASVAFQGVSTALHQQEDIVLIDTAGRLPHQGGLMDQLKKMDRVLSKQFQTLNFCPLYEKILVLDATTGQHGVKQIESFEKTLPLTGIALNKMDGTARGGILFHVAHTYDIPIVGIGVGEQKEDFSFFDAEAFCQVFLSRMPEKH